MDQDDRASDRPLLHLLPVVVLVGLAAAGCSEIHPEPNIEGGGVLQSPTHEQDALHRAEEREAGEEQDRRR
jgi:hypothetical protein